MVLDQACRLGAADGTWRFAAGDRVFPVGALELGGVSGLVERPGFVAGSAIVSVVHIKNRIVYAEVRPA
jgi:hypothetical protein